MPRIAKRRAIIAARKEPDMIRTQALVACLSTVIFVGSGAALAAAEPEAPPPIDWRDFVDDMDQGDHVVGEELCAVPGTTESLPDSYVVT